MPIFKFMNPTNNVIVEQYRKSVFDDSPFEVDGIKHTLVAVLDDYPVSSLLPSVIKHLFLNRSSRKAIMEEILSKMSYADRVDIMSKMISPEEWTLGKFVSSAQNPSSPQESAKNVSVKNKDRAKKKRAEVFGDYAFGGKSEIAGRGPTKITPKHKQVDKLQSTVIKKDPEAIEIESTSPSEKSYAENFKIINNPKLGNGSSESTA